MYSPGYLSVKGSLSGEVIFTLDNGNCSSFPDNNVDMAIYNNSSFISIALTQTAILKFNKCNDFFFSCQIRNLNCNNLQELFIPKFVLHLILIHDVQKN